MNRYRKELNKLLAKIVKIAEKGSEAIFEYGELIDEIVSKSQYGLFEDIMITKFGIDIRNFITVDVVKKETFDTVRRVINYTPQIFQKKLHDDNSVYSLGFHYYNSTNNQYIGDIVEVETNINLSEKKLIEIFLDLDAVVGLSQSILEAIPKFILNTNDSIKLDVGAQVLYENKVYHCIQSYTYSSTNMITPTYSTYWNQVSAPTYSIKSFTGTSTSLLEKYQLAINYLKSYSWTIV